MIDYIEPNFENSPAKRSTSFYYKSNPISCTHIDISIVTPYYNTPEFFLETYTSIQLQSLQNWEWLIIDDGSTDQGSIDRLAHYASKDLRIQVIRQTNGGTAAARNTGFHNAKGRYICLLDHDDLLEPTYLEKCAWFLDSHQEFAFCNSYSVIFDEQEFLWTTGYERGKDFLKANSGPPIAVIRRTAFEDCGCFDETIRILYEDWDFWLAMAKSGHWGYTIKEYLQWYRKIDAGRYEKILESGYDNNEFALQMQKKYKGLGANFPEPVRRSIQPYESIESDALVSNPLLENPNGRRIMFILPWMVTGGADRVNLDLIEGLTSQGHEITICATLLADHVWEHQFSLFTPDIFVLPNFLHETDYPRFLSYLIQSRQIDTVVITGSITGYQFLPYLSAVSDNVAFCDLCHVEEPDWLNGGHPRFSVGYQELFDLNIVTTQHLARWMRVHGADSERVKVMYTGVRAHESSKSIKDKREYLRREFSISADFPVIVFAGRLCEQKRPFLLAEILKKVQKQGLKFSVLIIGDGELKGEFENLINHYNLTRNVRLLGSVSHERWLEILSVADIFLMPSQYEGISIALLEAIASGVVPVVAKVGGQEEIVTQDLGILVQHGDNELKEYVNAVCQLVSNPKELKEKSQQCLVLALSKLSWDAMIDNFLALLNDAHHNKVNHPRPPISPRLAQEWATMSLELNRQSDTVNHLVNTNQHLLDNDLEYLRQCLAEKEKHLSEVINSNRWKLINLLSTPYRKIKEGLKRNRDIMKDLPVVNFDEYISLGDNCEAGFQFWRIGYDESSIFRFSVIDSHNLTTLLDNNFADIFLKEYLEPASVDHMVRDTKNKIAFHSSLYSSLDEVSGLRSFRNDYDFDAVYRQEKKKIDHLVKKWKDLVSSSKRVLYFIKKNEHSSRKDAENVLSTFLNNFPNHNFLIVYIQPKALFEVDWGYDKLHNVYVDFLAPYDNAEKGADTNGWDKIFERYPLKTRSD